MIGIWGRRRRQRRAAAAVRMVQPWSRQRLLLLFGALGCCGLLIVTGLGFAIASALTGHTPPEVPITATASVSPAGPGPDAVRDRIAAEPMLAVDRQAAFSPDATTRQAGSITIPQPTVALGPADVPTGFPRTPEGAAGQLAAIETLVLESMSVPVTRAVHTAWVRPGGPTLDSWELTLNVQAFLAAARQAGAEKDISTLVEARPAAALVKGSDGPDWTVACVLMDVRAAITAESRMGYGFCSRMVWLQGRWQVAAGAACAPAPSTWPGSALAVQAGWLTWTVDGQVR